MSRQHGRKPNGGPKLPYSMQQRLLSQHGESYTARKPARNGVSFRKEQTKTMKSHRRQEDRNLSARQPSHRISDEIFEGGNDNDSNNDPFDDDGDQPMRPSGKQLKSALKKRKSSSVGDDLVSLSEPSETGSRASSPELVLDASSRSFKDGMIQNNAEITALEKRLGLRKGKKRKATVDGFDDLLEGLDASSDEENQGKEEREWLNNKRRKAENKHNVEEDSKSDSELFSYEDAEEGSEGFDDEHSEGSIEDIRSANRGEVERDLSPNVRDLNRGTANSPAPRVRENPYRPPITATPANSKYVPPSLRKPIEGEQERLEKLRRQVQGQLNKLSEANMLSILGEIEKLYQTNPRQDTTSVLVENILFAFSSRSSLQNTFIILHAAFLAAVYKVLGNDFGAELVCKLVERFDGFYANSANTGKECLNLISLLANLFTFNVVSSVVIYDHIRLLLSEFSENNAELLLRVVRDCGPQLRSDDPTALKDIVQMMHNMSAELTKEGRSVNIRTRVMMDTIVDLKNNKMKQATNAAGVTGEHITRMRKMLGTMNSRQLRGTDALRISRNDITNSEKVGKWWLIGASWKGNADSIKENSSNENESHKQPFQGGDDFEIETDIDFSTLARRYKMNNDIRRSIFVAIMSAEDCHDALSRLGKLRLKRKQEVEIARVLLSCCRAEPVYNQFYAMLAKNLCTEKRHMMSFQFALWKFFEEIGEHSEDDENRIDSRDDIVELHEIVNVAKMYAYLIGKGSLQLNVLKTLNIGFTQKQGTLFLELLLVSLLCQPGVTDDKMMQIFGQTESRLVKSLKYFMRQKVRRSDLVAKEDQSRLKARCRIAFTAFDMIDALDSGRPG